MLSFPKLAIHTLNLAGNRITGIGLGMLSIGIGKNQVLQNVDISDNQIVSESEVDIQNLHTFAMALTDHKSLKSVNLKNCMQSYVAYHQVKRRRRRRVEARRKRRNKDCNVLYNSNLLLAIDPYYSKGDL